MEGKWNDRNSPAIAGLCHDAGTAGKASAEQVWCGCPMAAPHRPCLPSPRWGRAHRGSRRTASCRRCPLASALHPDEPSL